MNMNNGGGSFRRKGSRLDCFLAVTLININLNGV